MAAPLPPPRSGAGKGLEHAITVGVDLVRQARVARTYPVRHSRERQLAEAHHAALRQHEVALRKHRGRMAATKASAVTWFGSSGVLGVLAIGGVSDGGSALILGALTAGTAGMGARAMSRRRRLKAHPPLPAIPPLPPARLHRGARGEEQVDRVAETLIHLYDLVPSVGRLHPEAGQEMWRAVCDVEPLLRGQVERLESLNRLHDEMPGSRAAAAALDAGTVVSARLGQGADALEALLEAAVGMLAAPDLTGIDDILAPAITSLAAYRHGLEAASAIGRIST